MATALEALQNKASSITSNLQGSNTAYTPNTVPTRKDASMAIQLASVKKQIEDAKSLAIRNKWYGKNDTTSADTTATTAPKDGMLMSGLKALQKPLNAIAGTAQYALGKGVEPTLAGNINKAMDTGLTFGNILQQEGVNNRAISAPLGFALDVALDPVNWMTMGTAALVPRVGMGLIKGGLERGAVEAGTAAVTGFNAAKALEAGATGLKSGLAQKGATALNMIPFVKAASKLEPITEETARLIGQDGLTFGDKLRNIARSGSKKVVNFTEKVGDTAIKSADKYDTLMGTNVYDKLGKGMFGMPAGVIGKTAEELVSKIKPIKIMGMETPKGTDIVKFFKYSPRDAAKMVDVKDQITKAYEAQGLKAVHGGKPNFLNIDEALAKDATVNIKDLTKQVALSVVEKADDVGNVAIRNKETGELIPELFGRVKVADTKDNAVALLGTAADQINIDHLNKIYQKVMPGTTGVQWYDDFIAKAKATTFSDISGYLGKKIGMTPAAVEQAVQTEADNLVNTWGIFNGAANTIKQSNPSTWKPFNKILSGLEDFTALFKWMKVPLNPGSHVVANIGNYFMGAMMGLPVHDVEYLSSVKNASKLLRGKLGVMGIKKMFFDDANLLVNMAHDNPGRFKQVFGFSAEELASKINVEDLYLKGNSGDIVAFQEFIDQTLDDYARAMEQATDIENITKLREAVDSGVIVEKNLTNVQKIALSQRLSLPTAGETALKKLKEGTLMEVDRGGTFTSEELNSGVAEYIQEAVKSKLDANPNNIAYQLADFVANKMPRSYEHVDQAFKVGTVDYLSRIGLNEQQLITISRAVPISKEDILEPIIKGGQKIYKLTPLKASEVAMETYMNYAAMPDFVKVMRALPVIGSNFYSFQYAMAIKSGKTAINNLAAFNKIGFMLNEISGTRSPEEKIALHNKYNQYLNSPTVIKVMGQWNTDVKNMIPIYGMNMFNPSEKSYADSPQGNILKLSDSIPLFQTPIGQILKDYWIQPWILAGTGEAPQGQFGQPLYPNYDEKGNLIDPSMLTKLLYASRTLGEAVVPGVASYAGLIPGVLGASPELINTIPSYGARSVANASQGRSSIGAMTKEDKVRKTFRSILGRTGIPAYTLDTTNISTKDLPR